VIEQKESSATVKVMKQVFGEMDEQRIAAERFKNSIKNDP
jgi:hypothetical protein